MAERKYFWLKLKDDFFDEKYIKALRKLPDGDALVIIYLKLQLKSLKTEGFIRYDHIMPSVEEEIALFLDEDVQKVKLALQAIIGLGIAELWDEDTLYMSALQPLIGSEGASAERVRRHREMKALQCNTDVTACNTEKRREDKSKDKTERREKKESPPTPPLQGDGVSNFDLFWKSYPKKRSKGDAEKAWSSISPSEELFQRIMESLDWQKKSHDWVKEKGRFVPYPATWLRAKGWEDENGEVERKSEPKRLLGTYY